MITERVWERAISLAQICAAAAPGALHTNAAGGLQPGSAGLAPFLQWRSPRSAQVLPSDGGLIKAIIQLKELAE